VRLQGKVALVTGAASGLGRETVARFAAEGARVVAADLRYDAVAEGVSELREGLALELDVTDAGSIAAGLGLAVEHFGGLDVIVNSAGVLGFGAAHELAEAAWDVCMDVNLKGTYLVSKMAWPYLVERGGGVIVNLASIFGVSPQPANVPYCVSKAGVVMLTRCLAMDGAQVGIRANSVSPGYTMTAMTRSALESASDPDQAYREALARHPIGRLGEPEDIAGGILYLASDEASWVTGVNLLIDGGFTTGTGAAA
jgi:NAD(P)-dependent dehydrogenase (short-subunit alcohol dehydrogenase family)